jgi:hypothetical protein
MLHRGIEYHILQTISLGSWKWVVHISPIKNGRANSKRKAIDSAIKAIDRVKDEEKRAKLSRDGLFLTQSPRR